MKVASAIDTHMAEYHEKLLDRSFCLLCREFASETYHAGAVAAIVLSGVASCRQGYVCSTMHMRSGLTSCRMLRKCIMLQMISITSGLSSGVLQYKVARDNP
jgi:hypothetical protein